MSNIVRDIYHPEVPRFKELKLFLLINLSLWSTAPSFLFVFNSVLKTSLKAVVFRFGSVVFFVRKLRFGEVTLLDLSQGNGGYWCVPLTPPDCKLHERRDVLSIMWGCLKTSVGLNFWKSYLISFQMHKTYDCVTFFNPEVNLHLSSKL